MAKIKTAKARNTYVCEKCKKKINPGESYKSIKMMYKPVKIRCMYCDFKRSDTVSSEYLQRLYDIQDDFNIETIDDINSLVNDLQELAGEQREKFNNMPEGLQQGDVGQLLEERTDSIEDAISNIESVYYPESVDEIDVPDREEEESQEDYNERCQEALEEEQQNAIDDIKFYLNDISC